MLLVDCRADIGATRIVVGLIDDDLDALVGFEAEPRHALGLVEHVEHVEADRQAFAAAKGQHVLHADIGL